MFIYTGLGLLVGGIAGLVAGGWMGGALGAVLFAAIASFFAHKMNRRQQPTSAFLQHNQVPGLVWFLGQNSILTFLPSRLRASILEYFNDLLGR